MNQQNKTDLLEIFIILAMFLLIVVIYVPVAIWEDEEYYKKESRYRMQNLYDVESFYSRIIGEYNPSYLEALSVVNAVRDSTIADSLYFGEQILNMNNREYVVDVAESYGFEYDTTFGVKSFRKDTILDTILQIIVYAEALGRNDTSFIQKKELFNYLDLPDFIGVLNEEPIERVQAIEYYKTYIPDSLNNYCPLTSKPFVVDISEDNENLTVSSPIKEPIIKRHYLLFAFKAANHGVIKGGRKSWN
ncbi:MAG: hypothetical protein CMG55_09585 [Candidatus Marinimicrobia bacterium]|nr:hypothetical protein [Candidatus Neomarinimicrobiota bacterium]|tara:strand:- start:150 stop:890 length:741 start_codon:yes stop_codon:yes gene_type:complete